MCFPHFELVWASGGTSQARQVIHDVQRRAVAEVLDDLHEFIRKEGAECKHESKSKEQDAWRRAILLTAGWPAPKESASVPEARPAKAGWRSRQRATGGARVDRNGDLRISGDSRE
jgi:hypothetical protein